MEERSEVLKNNRTQDISWLCSLSEPELDLLISLKKLAIQRAEITDHYELADHFDLKLLRALGFVLMEYVRKKDTSLVPSAGHQLMGLDKCNLLKTHVDDTTIDIEEIVTGICKIKKKKKKRKPIRLRSKSLKSCIFHSKGIMMILYQRCFSLRTQVYLYHRFVFKC
ncbi:BnaCnng60160D [Brassica napus]|uniref:BnaCnng60160D protein n=1 Tax=Brassica napus TaxID=3708 RepID=A0A078JQI1_BRANA|nr:BnaCnng60160D [Brassica napus]